MEHTAGAHEATSAAHVHAHKHEHEAHRSAAATTWQFVRHFLEMVVAMLLGMAVWGALTGMALASTSLGAAIHDVPELRYGTMAVFMAAPMVWVMRWRRHTWERSWEMVAAMVVPMAVIVLCWRFGLGDYIPFVSDSALGGSTHVAMLIGMLALMLYRRNEYTHSGPHVAAARSSA